LQRNQEPCESEQEALKKVAALAEGGFLEGPTGAGPAGFIAA